MDALYSAKTKTRRRRGSLEINVVAVFGLIVVGLMMVVTAKEALWHERGNMDLLVRQAAKEIASEVSVLSAVDQGVRLYYLNWNFVVDLKKESVSVTYADENGNVTMHEYPHTVARGIVPAQTRGAGKICLSKKLEGCKPVITICKEGEACCTTYPSTCFFGG